MKKSERKSKKRDCKCLISATYSLSFLCGANGTRKYFANAYISGNYRHLLSHCCQLVANNQIQGTLTEVRFSSVHKAKEIHWISQSHTRALKKVGEWE